MSDDSSGVGKAAGDPRVSWAQVGLLVSSVVILAAVLGSILIWSGDDDAQVSPATPAGKRPVKVVIAGTNDAKEEVNDGGIVGEGTFAAKGAIADRGPVRAYRGLSVLDDRVILLRFVTKGREGAITYLTSSGQLAVVDRVCDQDVPGSSRPGHRERKRDLHGQYVEGEGLALAP
jgi:hypothetical protein